MSPIRPICPMGYDPFFLQHFGWYWQQLMHELGLDRFWPLRDSIPPDIMAMMDIDPWQTHATIMDFERKHNLGIHAFDHPPDIFRSSIPGIQEMYDLSQRLKILKKRVETAVECRLRRHFGFPERGKTLNNETVLYLIVRALCAPSEVLRNARPEFLGGLTLDIYIPERRLAIEYQGFQHFEPAEHLGGERHFRQTVRRDRRKKRLCRDNGLTLIEFDISDRLTEEDVGRKISQQGAGSAPASGGTANGRG